jgi:hypothetical protein
MWGSHGASLNLRVHTREPHPVEMCDSWWCEIVGDKPITIVSSAKWDYSTAVKLRAMTQHNGHVKWDHSTHW